MVLGFAPSSLPSSQTHQHNSNEAPPPSLSSSSHTHASWFKLLDKGGKGFVAKIDVQNALFSVGVEPTSDDVIKVVDSLATQSKLSNESALQSVVALLDSHGVDYDKLNVNLTFWRTYGVLLRTDDFVWLTSRDYFWKRYAAMTLGFPAYLYPMVPNFTTYEKGVHDITKQVLGTCTIVFLLMSLSVVLMRATSRLSWVFYPEILVSYGIISMAWAAQAARETAIWSASGRTNRDRWMFRIRSLRFYYFSKPNLFKSGELLPLRTSSDASCLHIVLTMLEGAGTLQTIITQLSQQGVQEKMRKDEAAGRRGGKQERRQTIIHDDFLQYQQGDRPRGTSHDIHSRFNIFQIKPAVAVPLLVALAASSLPTIYRAVKGVPCIGSAEYGAWDSAATVLLFFSFFFCIEFTFLVPVGDAVSELKITYLLSSYVCDSISLDRDISLERKQPFELRLDNTADVECFESIVKFCTAFHDNCAAIHVAAFECLGVISLSSAVLVFLYSLLGFQVDIYISLIFFLGFILLVPLAIVLRRLCTTHDLLTTTLSRRLLTQQRHNDELIVADFNVDNEHDRVQLLSANARIKILIDTIAESSAPALLLGILPLRHENVNRIVVSIGTVLLSTLLRQSLKQ